ncbi:MAG: hypothetical protein LDL11_00890 [Desulfarculus sp.]|nr:hypothetical protein [Desulfarculus sp.]
MARARRCRCWCLILSLALALVWLAPALGREPAPSPGDQTPPAAQPAPAGRMVYHGNLKSKKFHRPGCRYYDCPNCQAVFRSREQALAAGYLPCRVCRP